jgi:hypothetical protein
MVYGFRDVLTSALEVSDEHEIECDDMSKPQYVAIYKLVRVVSIP